MITRGDASLAVALIAGTLIAFQRPFRWGLDLVSDLEQRYSVDLLPALTLLTVVFVFHQYRKRLQARAQVAVLAGEVAHTRTRTEQLEHLVGLGQSLANALDRPALEQAIWRALHAFVEERECSVLSRQPAGFEFLVRDARMLSRQSQESLERDAARVGVDVDGDLIIPLIAGDIVVGSIIIRNSPAMTAQARVAAGAAGAIIAVALRNARMLQEAVESGANHPLTGCATRAHGIDQLQKELRRARRTQRPVSVIMFNVDDFKQVNDQHGHL